MIIIDDCTEYSWRIFLKKKVSCQTKLMSWWESWRQNTAFKLIRFNVIIQVRIVQWKHSVKNEEMILLLSIQHLAHLSKMVVLSKNLQCWLTEWDQCWMELILLTLEDESSGLMVQYFKPFQELYHQGWQLDKCFSTIFGKREMKTCCHRKNLMKIALWKSKKK